MRTAEASGAQTAPACLASNHRLALSVKQLAQVAVGTLLVAGCPIAAVWWLRVSGTVSSAALGVVIGMCLSIGASYLGCLVWEQRPGSEDLLFSELMLWGYLHRWHTQRRLASALDMVRPMSDTQSGLLDGLGTREQAKLLARLVSGIETRDPYLHGHSRRVARHSWMIARKMGLSRAEVARIRTAAAVHDVGKIKTPTEILHKAGTLSDEEYEVIKSHPGDGAVMADILRDPALTAMVRHHHERLDGTGYPDMISGEGIPLGARIIAVADTFDAITSGRSYRPASAHKKAIDILREEAGTKLDPDVVRAFCGHYAGRAPIVLASALAGVPERVATWLASSVGSVASAAKVVAVAALVGSVAATSAAVSLPAVNRHGRQTPQQPPGRAATRAVGVPIVTASAISLPATATGGRRSSRHAVVAPGAYHRAPAAAAAAAATAPEALDRASSQGAGQVVGTGATSGEDAAGKGEHVASAGHSESPGARSAETPSTAKSAETPGKGKAETPGKGTTTETPGKSKATETPGKGTSTETSGKSEAPSTGKTTEGPSKETTTETPGKSGEATSKGEGVVEKVVGKVKELLPKV